MKINKGGNIKPKGQKKLAASSKVGKYYIFLVLLLAFTVHSPTLNNGFVNNWDDDGYILNNSSIQTLSKENTKSIFSSFHMGNYHPLTTLTYALEYHFFGLNARYYHFNNLVLHLLNVFFVFVLVGLLFGRNNMALIAALLFAIHPMHVESVGWISERKDVLYALFFLLSLIMYLKYSENNQIKFYALSILFFLFSLLSKSAAVSLPMVLVACLFFRESGNGFALKKYVLLFPFFALSLLFGIIALKSQGASTQYLTPDYTIIQRLFTGHFALLFYMYKFVLPFNLSAFYPHPTLTNGVLPTLYYLSPIIVWGIFAGLYFFLIRHKKVFVFGLLFFLFAIILVIQFIPVGGAITADRYTYVPYIGLYVWVAFLFHKYVLEKKRVSYMAVPLGLLLVLVFSVQTFARHKVWENGITLFDDVIRKYPDSFYAYHSRGIAHYYNNDFHKALQDYDMAVALNDKYGFTLYNRGLVHNILQQFDKAEFDYTKAIELMPNNADAFNDRAIARLNLNKAEGALADLDRAIELNAENGRAFYNRGVIYIRKGAAERACQDFESAVRLGVAQAYELQLRYCNEY